MPNSNTTYIVLQQVQTHVILHHSLAVSRLFTSLLTPLSRQYVIVNMLLYSVALLAALLACLSAAICLASPLIITISNLFNTKFADFDLHNELQKLDISLDTSLPWLIKRATCPMKDVINGCKSRLPRLFSRPTPGCVTMLEAKDRELAQFKATTAQQAAQIELLEQRIKDLEASNTPVIATNTTQNSPGSTAEIGSQTDQLTGVDFQGAQKMADLVTSVRSAADPEGLYPQDDDVVSVVKRAIRQCKHVVSTNKAHLATIVMQNGRIAAQKDDIRQLIKEKLSLEDQVQDLQDDKDRLNKPYEEIIKRLKDRKNELKDHAKSSAKQAAIEKEAADKAERQLKDAKIHYEDQLAKAAKDVKDVEGKLANAKKCNPVIFQQTVDQVRSLHRERDDAREAQDAAVKEALQAKKREKSAAESLEGKIREVGTAIEAKEHAEKELTILQSKMDRELKKTETKLKVTETKLLHKAKDMAKTREIFSNKIKDLRRLMSEAEVKGRGQLLTAEAKIQTLDGQNKGLQTTNESLHREIESIWRRGRRGRALKQAGVEKPPAQETSETSRLELQTHIESLTTRIQELEQATEKPANVCRADSLAQIATLQKHNNELKQRLDGVSTSSAGPAAPQSQKLVDERIVFEIAKLKQEYAQALADKDREAQGRVDTVVMEKLRIEQRREIELAQKEQEVLARCEAAFNERQAAWNGWKDGAEKTLAALHNDIQDRDTKLQAAAQNLLTSRNNQAEWKSKVEVAEANAETREKEVGEQRTRAHNAEQQIEQYKSGAEHLKEKLRGIKQELAKATASWNSTEVGSIYLDLDRANDLLEEVGTVPMNDEAMTVLHELNNMNTAIATVKLELKDPSSTASKGHLLAVLADDIENIDEVDSALHPVLVNQAHAANRRLKVLRDNLHAAPKIRANMLLAQLVLPRGDEDVLKSQSSDEARASESSKRQQVTSAGSRPSSGALNASPAPQPSSSAPPFISSPGLQYQLGTNMAKGPEFAVPKNTAPAQDAHFNPASLDPALQATTQAAPMQAPNTPIPKSKSRVTASSTQRRGLTPSQLAKKREDFLLSKLYDQALDRMDKGLDPIEPPPIPKDAGPAPPSSSFDFTLP